MTNPTRSSRPHVARQTGSVGSVHGTERERATVRGTRYWIDLVEHDDQGHTGEALPGSRCQRGGAVTPTGVHSRSSAPKRFRWGVPGFVVDAPAVLASPTPADAARTLVALLRARGALEPHRRRLLIALYELEAERNAAPRRSTRSENADAITARIGAIVELAPRRAARVALPGPR